MNTHDFFYLSEVIGRKVFWQGKRIGRLSEIIIVEKERIPEVTHFIIKRPFGYPSLMIPWSKIKDANIEKIELSISHLDDYVKSPSASQILLKDHVLDKKVIDLEGNEVEVVYDAKLVIRHKKLYVSDVDFSKYGLLRRLGLKWLANLIYNLADLIKEETLSWDYIQPLEQINSFKGNVRLKMLKEKLPEIHPVDLADILEELDHKQRLVIFNELEIEQASDTLEEVEPRVQRDIILSLTEERAAVLISNMTPAQAADVLAILPASDTDNILAKIDPHDAKKIQFIIDKHDEKIIHFASTHFLKATPSTTAGEFLSQYRTLAQEADVIMYVYIVKGEDTLLGVVDIREILLAEYSASLEELMTTHVIGLSPDSSLKEASGMFSRYSFRAIPIVDDENTIFGVLPFRDIMNLKHVMF